MVLLQRSQFVWWGVVAVVACLLQGCRASGAMLPPVESSRTLQSSSTTKLTFSGSEAVHFSLALRNAGVSVQRRSDGIDQVAVDTMTCHDDHTTTGPVECVVVAAGKSLPMTGEDASMVFATLRTADKSPSHTVTATDVSCVVATQPLPKTSCTFTR